MVYKPIFAVKFKYRTIRLYFGQNRGEGIEWRGDYSGESVSDRPQ